MSDPSPPSLSILIADDEEAIRMLIRHWLHRAGHVIECVGSGAEATRLLRQKHFDVVITDIVMPDGDGYELIATFRQVQPSARIVAISGGGQYLASEDCLKIARGLGAHAAVIKPFNWEQLHAGIKAARATVDTR